jgi:hypothetical protein
MQRGLDAEIRWFTIKAILLDLHDNLIDTLCSDCYPALERLELYRQATLLKDQVEAPPRRGDYWSALAGFRQFIADRNVYRTHVLLFGAASYEKMLTILAANGATYGVPE